MGSMKTEPRTSSQAVKKPQADTGKARRPVLEVDAAVITSGSCAMPEAQARCDRNERGKDPRGR